MINKYRKKPVVVEVIQFKGYNDSEIERWSEGKVITSPIFEPTENNPKGVYLQIHTLEGVMVASIGDFIVKDVEGEFWAIKPSIFAKTYELVSDGVIYD